MPEYIPLAFGLEAMYPPMKLMTHQLRELYNHLADPCRFTEFRQLGESQGARLSEGANRHLTLAGDRFAYRDDFTQTMFTTFVEDVEHVLKSVKEIFHIPVMIHSKVLVRLLMPYQGEGNTVEYFQKSLFQSASANFGEFGRPLSGMGVKMVFPPTQEFHSTFNIRMEPYLRDVKMFYLENSAQFFDPIVNFPDITKKMETAYNFLKEKAGPFILNISPEI